MCASYSPSLSLKTIGKRKFFNKALHKKHKKKHEIFKFLSFYWYFFAKTLQTYGESYILLETDALNETFLPDIL